MNRLFRLCAVLAAILFVSAVFGRLAAGAVGHVIYVDGALSDGLTALWRFEEGSGSTTADFSGGRHTLAGPAWSSDVAAASDSDQSLSFDGVNDYIDTWDFDIGDDFTVAAWVNPGVKTSHAILSKHTSSGGNLLILGIYSSQYHVNLRGQTLNFGAPSSGWQHLAVTGVKLNPTQTQITFYRDGVVLGSSTVDAVVGDFTGKAWTIGQDWDGSSRTDFFSGNIDDVRVYEQALSGGDVALLAGGAAHLQSGASWGAALPTIQHALSVAESGDEIWVKAGSYGAVNSAPWTALRPGDGVTIYGGFAGSETTLGARDWASNVTTFNHLYDGVAIGPGVAATVDGIDFQGNNGATSTSNRGAMVEGDLTLRNGALQGGFIQDETGGGAFVTDGATALFDNVMISDNEGEGGGGGLSVEGTATVRNGIIRSNEAGGGWNGGAAFVKWGAHLTLDNTLVESNISSRNGAIHSGGFLTVTNGSIIRDHQSTSLGAGITAFGGNVLIADGATIEDNSTTSDGGAIYSDSATVTLNGAIVRNNHADAEGGGLFIHSCRDCGRATAAFTNATIVDSVIEGNSAKNGGGIATYRDVAISGSQLLSNTATTLGGALYITGDWMTDGSTTISDGVTAGNRADASGGAIYSTGMLTVNGGVYQGNSAAFSGGAIFTFLSDATIDGAWFDDNIALTTNSQLGGGAVFNSRSDMQISNSLFSNNRSNWNGGAIHAYGTEGSLQIDNTTISNNHAGAGGALAAFHNEQISISHSTIVNNTGFAPAWSAGIHVYADAVATLDHTIVANNTGSGQCETNLNGAEVVSAGYNLISDASCGFSAVGDQQSTDPLLAATLATIEGSRLQARLPLDGSPAIDAGDPNCSGFDMRGAARPQGLLYDGEPIPGTSCDIGAIEVSSAMLAGYQTPYTRFFDWTTLNQLQPAIDFRSGEISDPANEASTTLDDILLNYRSFQNGWLFYRFCADYDSFVAGQPCTPFADLPAEEQEQKGGQHDDAFTSRDIYNDLLAALAAFQWIDANQPGSRAAAYETETSAAYELANIPLVYGNEFMVDALRYSFGPAQQLGAASGAEMIQAEIDQLSQAMQQFAIAADLFVWLANEPIGGGVLADYFAAELFATFAVAHEREMQAAIEIIQRKRLLGVDSNLLLAEIDDVFQRNYLAANLLMTQIARSSLPAQPSDAAGLFLENGGWQMMHGLENLIQLAESIRTDGNLLGYDDLYVPRSAYETLRQRMGTLGTCDTLSGTVSGGSGELLALLQKECAAGVADRSFDQNRSDLIDELADLENRFGDDLLELCGLDVSDPNADLTLCTAGEMDSNYSKLEAAHLAAALAWQRAQNIPALIAIEEQRAGTIINVIFQSGQQLQALEVANGKLRAYREVTTSARTNEVWAEGSDPNEPGSTAYWLDFGKDALNCLLSGATAGNLGDGCAGNNDNLFQNIGTLLGIETTPTRIETIETISDPNELEIAGNVGMMAIREAERDAAIEGANSHAEIRRLLLEQSDLLIEYEIAVQELNRVISERNLLIQRHRRALNEYRRLQANTADDFIETPALRLIRDQTAANAEVARERALHTTYLTLKALEYTLLDAPVSNNVCGVSGNLLDALYQARTASHLNDILCEMDNITLPLDGLTGNQYPVSISIAEDVWGLTDDNLQELLPYMPQASSTWPADLPGCGPLPQTITTVDTLRFCLFQERLRRVTLDNADVRVLANNDNLPLFGQSIYFNFNSQLEDIVERGDYGRWNIRIAANNSQCPGCGVRVNIVTGQSYSGGAVSVYLTHQGQATYRQANGDVVAYNPGVTAILGQAIPAGWPSGSAVNAAIIAAVNGSGGLTNSSDLSNLSAATTDWRLRLDLSGSGSGLDVDQLEDFVIALDTLALTVNSRRVVELRQQIAALEADGQPVPAALRAELSTVERQLAREQQQSQRSAAERRAPSATPPVFSDDVIGGSYSGSVFVAQPAPLGIFDVGVTITRTGSALSGELCATCSPLVQPVAVSGVYSAGITDTFSLTSAPFTTVIGGKTVTRIVTLSGAIDEDGNVLVGSYQETISGYADEPIGVSGDWLATRPMQLNQSIAVPTAVTLQSQTALAPAPLILLLLLSLLSSATALALIGRRESTLHA